MDNEIQSATHSTIQWKRRVFTFLFSILEKILANLACVSFSSSTHPVSLGPCASPGGELFEIWVEVFLAARLSLNILSILSFVAHLAYVWPTPRQKGHLIAWSFRYSISPTVFGSVGSGWFFWSLFILFYFWLIRSFNGDIVWLNSDEFNH